MNAALSRRPENMKSTAEKGRQGEKEAEIFLQKAGYSIIERNYRRTGGEIDLIVRKNDEIIFAEVKKWSTFNEESMEQGIPRSKMRRILKTSRAFLMEHPEFDDFHIRYDIVFLPGAGKEAHHIKDAFREE
ncbi:MAG: YraN family protein [Spirochaetales bacterium]|jgi:putative endonuclease|nr:YraN family protein [Spirochaetales bacterium]